MTTQREIETLGAGQAHPAYLARLLRFVASHDMIDPVIVADAVQFGIEFTRLIDGQTVAGVQYVTVKTLAEARDQLGY